MRIFASTNPQDWEDLYRQVLNKKYQKGIKNFSTKITGRPIPGNVEPPVFLVAWERGNSYLDTPLQGIRNNKDVQFCQISKGFAMGDLSSFSLGPIVGEGLCIVNACWSKTITIAHIEGGGVVDLTKKNFWKRARRPLRSISFISENEISVNRVRHNTIEWLTANEHLWFNEFQYHADVISLCSDGDFHWNEGLGDIVGYRQGKDYLSFVEWKKRCYIEPAYELIPKTDEFKFIKKVFDRGIPLGLVHPMSRSMDEVPPITRAELEKMFDSTDRFVEMPYVVAAVLLGVKIYE
jgi:hypothetical protein